MVWVGRGLKTHVVLSSAMARDTFYDLRVVQALSSLAWDTLVVSALCVLFEGETSPAPS